jgi:hypothetical protein
VARSDDFAPAPTSADDPDLHAIAEALSGERKEAINWRSQTGIETQWQEDEEFYQGIDDVNRDEARATWGTKPPGQSTPPTIQTSKSKVFPNITRPYVDAASARIADMLLPNDDRSWGIKPTPIPDLVDVAEGNMPEGLQQQAAAMGADPLQLQQQAQKMIAEATQKAEAAQDQIEDWHVEGQWTAEVRKVIEDAARIGTGVLKGPVPVKRRIIALGEAQGQQPDQQNVLQKIIGGIKSLFNAAQTAITTLIVKEEIKPASNRVDPWNCFPDPSCGENIHNGSFFWERDYLTRKQVEDLRDGMGYLKDELQKCLEEGPQKAIADTKKKDEQPEDKRFEVWYRYGTLNQAQMGVAGCKCEDQGDSIPAIITMINDRVVKAVMNPLDSGEFPYDVMPWQRKQGMPWGNGVGRHGRTPQRITTAAVRNMMDNAGLSAGVQIVMGTQIEPADGTMTLTPRKIWRFNEDADNDDVRKAMTFFDIQSRQKELLEIVQYGMKLMEDATGLPMLLQGQQGTAPDTVGGMTMLFNNASAVLRRLARTFDDYITKPHIRRYYTWILQYGKDSQKGDFSIDARGSTALVERDLQTQHIPEMLKAAGNPIYGVDPKKAMNQWIKAMRFNPADWEFDDDKWQQIVERLSQKPADPRVEVQKIKEQGLVQREEADRQFEGAQKERDRQVDVLLKSMDEHLEAMKLQGVGEQTIQQIKADLAELAMKLRTQQQLAANDNAIELHKHHNPPPVINPPVEPPGRAAPGKAFQA